MRSNVFSVVLAGVSLAAMSTAVVAGTLQPRDINADGVVDALYDPVHNVSWLADANYAGTLGVNAGPWFLPGQMGPSEAADMAASLNIHGVTGWRLPHAWSPGCENSTTYCDGAGASEFPATDEGFHNVGAGLYYTDSFAYSGNYSYWILSGFGGNVFLTHSLENGLFFAEFVHDGDVASIPEPSTWALLAGGLGAIALSRRRRAR
jgi:hypothetical protein